MPRKKPKCVSQTHPMMEGQIAWRRRRRSVECEPILVDYRRKVIITKGNDNPTEIMVRFMLLHFFHFSTVLINCEKIGNFYSELGDC